MTVTAVAFDLDYTLAVPERDRQTLLDDAVDRVDAPPISREAYLGAHGGHLTADTREPIFAELLADRESEVEPVELTDAYRELVTASLVPVEGVADLVAGLGEEYRVGLLTNGPVAAQREKISALGWTDAFDASLVTGELEAGKPDGRAFEALTASLGVPPEETVYVGDNVDDDIGGASAAGLRPVQVLFSGGPDTDDRAVAHVERRRLADRLPEILASL